MSTPVSEIQTHSLVHQAAKDRSEESRSGNMNSAEIHSRMQAVRGTLKFATCCLALTLLSACGDKPLNDAQVDQVSEIAGGAASEIYLLAERVETLENEVSEREDQINALSERLDDLEARIDDLEG